MTLILKLYLDMVKMSHHIQNEVSMVRNSKVIARTDRHTDRQNENITFPYKWAVIIDVIERIIEVTMLLHN